MALLESAFYTVLICIFTLAAYAFPLLLSGKLLGKVVDFLIGVCLGSAISKEPLKSDDLETWPLSWLTDERHFELEQEVIFTKKWLFVAHFSEFKKPGDYRSFKIAGFPVLIILGKDRQLRAFHNVCRHRAYAVTKKESGSSTVLGCRYHGWVYDTKGKLIKAPEFDKVPGFDKSINGLWQLRVKVKESLVFISIDNNSLPGKVGTTEIKNFKRWRLGDMACVERWTIEPLEADDQRNNFNWKLLGSTEMNDEKKQESWLFEILASWFNPSNRSIFLAPGTRLQQLNKNTVLIMSSVPYSADRTALSCVILSRKKQSPTTMDEWKGEVDQYVERLTLKYRDMVAGQRQEINLKPLSNRSEEISALLRPYINGESRQSQSDCEMAGNRKCFTKKGKRDDDFCRQLEHKDSGHSVCAGNPNLAW